MVKTKICGIQFIEEVHMLNELMPEYAGFVFAKSKRQISMEIANRLREQLNDKIQTVGVFVKEPIENIVSLCQAGIIGCIQLHGEETLDYIEELKSLVNNPIIYAKRVKKEENTILEELPVDYFLFDSYVEGVYGGSGKMVDYSYVPKVNKPWFLAGGLSPDNIATVLSKVTPYSVDVSSGVEAQGMKSFDKMKCFIEMVRREETLV